MNPAEQKIRTALEKAALYHREEGLEPNDAIIKAAQEERLNPPMTERVIEGFNIAKTNAVLSRANDKTASFPVAERDTILDGVFGQGLGSKAGETKTASVELEDSFNEVALSGPSLGGFQKAAQYDGTLQDHDLTKLVHDGVGGLTEMKGDLSKFAQDTMVVESDMVRAMREIGDYFSLVENTGKYAEFELDILSERGQEAQANLDVIHRHFCPAQTRADWVPKLGTRSYQATSAHDAFDALCESTDLFIQREAQMRDLEANFICKKAEFDQATRGIVGVFPAPPPTAADFFLSGADALRPTRKVGAQIQDGSAASFIGSPGGRIKKADGGVADSLQELASFPIDVSPAASALKGMSAGVSAQAAETHGKLQDMRFKVPKAEGDIEMDNIRRSTILRELMAHDEIISKHKPEDVQRVYNTMLSIAPNVTMFPGVVQSVLRTSLSQQAVDPFTAKQFADLEGQHHKNKMLSKEKAPTPGL